MKGDFSLDSFNRFKHFRRVLMQQGRVQLDADWNEQVSILLHYIETLAADIIGPYAGPTGDDYGFAITSNGDPLDFKIGQGRYYVNGLLCENYPDDDISVSYLHQLDYPHPPALASGKNYVVYLDVWERHITYLEDDDIREKALGGPDTATRAKTVWQVKVKEISSPSSDASCEDGVSLLTDEMNGRIENCPCLRAYAKRDKDKVDPCLIEPESRYRGAENQLYRVEVHDGGSLVSGEKPTFKWSRENGSVAFPIMPGGEKSIGAEPVILELKSLGRDARFGLEVNDWVEIEDDDSVLMNKVWPLLQVIKVDRFEMTVTLKRNDDAKESVNININSGKHALLRRWDQKNDVLGSGVLEIREPDDGSDDPAIELEDGIIIEFKSGGKYRKGDYWLIPARSALGDVIWPESDEMKANYLTPHGVIHYFAPLAIISVGGTEVDVDLEKGDCRCAFASLSSDCPYNSDGHIIPKGGNWPLPGKIKRRGK